MTKHQLNQGDNAHGHYTIPTFYNSISLSAKLLAFKFICRYIPLKQWNFDDSHSPKYQKFKVDELPIIKTFIKQDWQFLNLPNVEFDLNDFKGLYHLRWDEETAYRDLKYPLCLKAFHSKQYKYIVQEVWARAILYNFCSEISMHVEIPEKDRKHAYPVNYSQAIKTCRNFLRDRSKTKVLDVEGLIAQNIEPIRPGRTFARQARFKLPMSFCYRN